MIKIAVYNYRQDEAELFERYKEKYQVDIVKITCDPTLETTVYAKGCNCISVTSDSMITPPMLDEYQKMGIQFISSRTIGLDHIDVEYANSLGIAVSNISYSIEGVADEAIMLMLMSLRKIKQIMLRNMANDYTLIHNRGKDISQCTVGIIGTGKIGTTVIEHIQGFKANVIAYDPYPKINTNIKYVTLDELLKTSDIISLHLPMSNDNYHLLDSDAFKQMKDGVIIINTSRGPLIDTSALIDALEIGKVAGAGLDVVEGDRNIYYRDYRGKIVEHREMAILNAMANVIMLPHIAFFTEQAVSDMVENSIKNCVEYINGF